ncbi:MAG TPA: LuxR C-terminal-related transcriptional regulator [Actinospica sp.]|nr:LuxR C-terminal-related transcriptional regulator [Actinospica sp.]
MSDRIVSRDALFEQLGRAGRIIGISAPAGSGKTTLLRSWVRSADLAERATHVSVQGAGRDPQRFWIAVVDALRGTAAGSELVRPLTAAPELDGWAVVEQLLADLVPLRERIWLIIDDLHELAGTETLSQLQLLMLRAPAELRFLLATRHDMSLGLHRLRLDGELTEIRASRLRFTLEESGALFEAAGLSLSEQAVALLHRRTEGWAAGLRLAALSLAGHPDPDSFAAEFSGNERTVAEYLLAEVLEQQPAQVRELLLRTSVLDRVNGRLADLLTGGSGGEQILLDLEQAGAFVLAVDPHRSWFRYHRLFADLLQLELRRTGSARLPELHAAAAGWYAANGFPVDAIRHAQAARDWGLAARLLSAHWVDLYLDGQGAAAEELLAGFPGPVADADAELAVLMAARDLDRGSLQKVGRRLALAVRGSGSVPEDRRKHFEVMCTVLRLRLVRRQGDLPAVAEEAERLLAAVETADAMQEGLGDALRALALLSLGSAEVSALRLDGANRHPEQGIALAQRIGRPYLELSGLAYDAQLAVTSSYTAGAERSLRAIELARKHGWSDKPVTTVAWAVRAEALIVQGRPGEAEPWLARAQRTLQPEANPVAGVNLRYVTACFELARGEHAAALATLRAAEQLAHTLVTPHVLLPPMRARVLHAMVRLGEARQVERALAEMQADERGSTPMRTVEAALRLAQSDPQAARDALATHADDSRAGDRPLWAVAALLLEATACDALGRADDAAHALERALDAAEPDHLLFPFLLHPAPGLLERHAGRSTAHGALTREILSRLGTGPGYGAGPRSYSDSDSCAGTGADTDADTGRDAAASARSAAQAHMREPLSGSEMRVLRYLPTNLSAPEIAAELSLSVNTVRTHMRHVYEKLGAHRRFEAVELARSLGLVAAARP